MSETFADTVDAEDLHEERLAVADIRGLDNWRQTAANVEREIRKLDPKGSDGRYDRGSAGRLRRWLLDHPGEPLYDREHGLKAYLQSGGEDVTYEAPQFVLEGEPSLFDRLLKLGCLRIDGDRVKTAMRDGLIASHDLASWTTRGERSPSLRIVKE